MLIIGILSISVSFVLTWVLREYALRYEVIDVPNARSSHIVPTPRGGGLGFVITFMLASVWMWFQESLHLHNVALLLIGGGTIAFIGFLDDHIQLSRKLRIAVHFLASAAAITYLGGLPTIPLFGMDMQLGYFGYLLGAIGLVWLINLYNFMDGIDGIAAVEAITITLLASVILWYLGDVAFSHWLICLAFAVFGFLVWNWSPAKIFMGDVGSSFLGFILGIMAIMSSQSSIINLWAWGILLAVFITDTIVTLLCRILKGDKWYEAHKNHAYQKASRRWKSHLKVTLIVAFINVFWLFPLAFFAASMHEYAVYFFVLAYIPLIFIVFALRAGYSDL